MKLSILIPNYNYDCLPLAKALSQEITDSKLEDSVMIIVAEDGSRQTFGNQSISDLPNCVYVKFDENRGRAAIRNSLAEMAPAEYLLFADSDSLPPHSHFIADYLAAASRTGADVICGGVDMPPAMPSPEVSLRYVYGMKVERNTAAERSRTPYASFKTFNFLIRKSTFQSIRFDESFTCYGHEDTFFGLQLERQGVKIAHIDNALIHMGLEPNGKFLEKTRKAVEALAFHRSKMQGASRLLALYARLERYRLTALVSAVSPFLTPAIDRHLRRSAHPSLTLFNIYKTMYLCRCMKRIG